MAGKDVSRRGLLGMGFGLGVTATVGSATTPAAFADDTATGASSGRPVRMVLHTHSCFSEGGSWAAGGGGASMMAQLEQAVGNDIDVVWWTDHDWRMEAYGYYDGIAFDGTDEDGGLQWFVQNEGAVADAEHAFVQDPHSPNEPGKALRVSASGAPGHNPFVLYPSITDNPERLNKVVPLTPLSTDIANNKVPEFVWITPNLCHDMHMGPGCDTLDETQLERLGDNFVDEWVTRIMKSNAWTGNSSIFITYDEGPGGEYCCDSVPVTAGNLSKSPEVHGGGNVPMIVISRHGSRGYTNNEKYNHYSLLRTIEENWNLGYLGFASDSRQVHSLTPFLRPSS